MDNNSASPLAPTEETIITDTAVGTNPPPTDGNPVSTTTTTVQGNNGGVKRKMSGKIIATVFGLMLLIAGIGAGLVLVSKQQLINQKAAGCTPGCSDTQTCINNVCRNYCAQGSLVSLDMASCTPTTATISQAASCTGSLNATLYYCPGGLSNGVCLENPTSAGPYTGGQTVDIATLLGNRCGAIQLDVSSNSGVPEGCGTVTYYSTATNCGGGGGSCGVTCSDWCTSCTDPAACANNCPIGYTNLGSTHCNWDGSNVGPCTNGLSACYKQGNSCLPPSTNPPTATPTAPPTIAPTPTPTPIVIPPAPACYAIKAYDSNWNQLTTTQLSALAPNTGIYFTVVGASGNFDSARFTINGIQLAPTTLTKPGTTDEFYTLYTTQGGVTNVGVLGQLHDTVTNQWY